MSAAIEHRAKQEVLLVVSAAIGHKESQEEAQWVRIVELGRAVRVARVEVREERVLGDDNDWRSGSDFPLL